MPTPCVSSPGSPRRAKGSWSSASSARRNTAARFSSPIHCHGAPLRAKNNLQKEIRILVKLVESPIDPAFVYDSICSAYSGSVVLHYAIVKRQAGSGKSTTAIEYRAQADSILELEGIAEELERRWKLEDVLLIRRTG